MLIFIIWLQSQDYSIIVATFHEPTVLPPSQIRLGEPCVTDGVFSHRRELKKKSIVKMPKIQAFKGIKNKIKSLITTLFLA